jgi:hypothetical protein
MLREFLNSGFLENSVFQDKVYYEWPVGSYMQPMGLTYGIMHWMSLGTAGTSSRDFFEADFLG